MTGSLLPAPIPGVEFYVNIVLKTIGSPSVLDANFLSLRYTCGNMKVTPSMAGLALNLKMESLKNPNIVPSVP